jgi:hypothetical protein
MLSDVFFALYDLPCNIFKQIPIIFQLVCNVNHTVILAVEVVRLFAVSGIDVHSVSKSTIRNTFICYINDTKIADTNNTEGARV